MASMPGAEVLIARHHGTAVVGITPTALLNERAPGHSWETAARLAGRWRDPRSVSWSRFSSCEW
ncbi:hypothetical protein ACFUN7_03085 [Streptomyces sp. NPDC057236]|uniref:hypothetical protein n=1 Tax=Streptomyces sp. NPDC057236 TaxID=3346059 RepID=UPI0036405D0A